MKYAKNLLMTVTSVIALSFPATLSAAEVVAKVNGKDITDTDLKQLEQALPPELLQKAKEKGDIKADLINQLVDLKVLTDAAMAAGLDKKKDVQDAIARSKEQVIVQAFVFEQLKSKVNDAAIEAEYKTLKDKFMAEIKDKKEVKVRHILVADEAAAKKVIDRLKAGEDFQKLARELSVDKQSGQDGGDLGYILEGTVADFDAALAAIKTGQTSAAPTKTQFGYHIFKVDDRRAAKPPKFEDVKDQLGQRVQQKAFIELVKKLRDKATVEIVSKDAPAAAAKAAAAPAAPAVAAAVPAAAPAKK